MSKLDEAIKFATDAHAGQKRKLVHEPYILHPLEAATIVAKLTRDEDVICAALLHDVVEDTPHELCEIREKFGNRVAELVGAETEDKRSHIAPEKTWRIRKEESLDHLRHTKDRGVQILWLGDKLSNVRSILNAYLQLGDEVWKAFNEKDKQKQRWYYESIAEALEKDFGDTGIFMEYKQIVTFIFGKVDKNELQK